MESNALQITLNVDGQRLQFFWFRQFGSGCSGLNFVLTIFRDIKQCIECLLLLLVEFGDKALQAEKK
jgi:hypothetical protein